LYSFPLFIILAISFSFTIHSFHTSFIISNFNLSNSLINNNNNHNSYTTSSLYNLFFHF
jgi:hypothetical protein